MAPLAGWMSRAGHTVVGYDDNLQEMVRSFLEDAGVETKEIVLSEQINAFTRVVYSSAVKADHPLLKAALEHGLETLRRGELLAEIAASKRLVAIVGSHGKTTTTGMIAHAAQKSGFDVNYIVGGFFSDPALPPSNYSESDWLIAEVDESDGTIDHFSPEITVLLNADWDHTNRYSTADMLDQTFQELMDRTRSCVLLPKDGIEKQFSTKDKVRKLTFGEGGDFCSVIEPDEMLRLSGEFDLENIAPLRGDRINYINGTAALAVLKLLSVKWPADVLSDFGGIARRQTVLHKDEDLIIVEDYAHHSTEMVTLFESLRAMAPDRQLVVVFQPHRYSRTHKFKQEFVSVLQGVDKCFLLPVYSAYEPVLEGGTTEAFIEAFRSDPPTVLKMNSESALQLAQSLKGQRTLLAFVGAGDIHLFAGLFTALYQCGFNTEAAWQSFLQGRVSPECTLKESEPLASKTTMRIGGAARFYAEPNNLFDLRMLLSAAGLFDLKTFCLGRGSNILVPDAGFDGVVIRLSKKPWRHMEVLSDGRIWVSAGVRLKELCGYAAKAGLTGFEFLEGIPGSVGGALRMNAGAMGKWIFDVVERVQLLNGEMQLHDLPKDAFTVEYRQIREISHGIALGAILKSAETEEAVSIRDRMDGYANLRKSSQPREPSAGCIFKNPEGNFAGKLIDTHGLKGLSVGGAEVSNVHGNFIVNKGGASADDVIELVRKVRTAVHESSGYHLNPEVLLLGDSWDTVLEEGHTSEDSTDVG